MSFTALKTLRPFFTNDCGRLLAGGKVYSYEPGTLTPKPTYKDVAGSTENTNPIILDASGEADIYINSDYRFQIFDRDGVLIDDIDLVAATQRVSSEFVLDASGLTQGQINNDVRLEQGQALTPTAAWPDVLSLIDQNGAPSIHDIPMQALLNRIQKLYEDAVLLSSAISDRYTKTEADTRFASLDANIKVPIAQQYAASTTQSGIVQLVNDLTTGGTDKALTAEQGKVLNSKIFGLGQIYNNVTASRVKSTNYTNTSAKTIAVFIVTEAVATGTSLTAIVNGVSFVAGYAANTRIVGVFFVPPGGVYQVVTTPALNTWFEF